MFFFTFFAMQFIGCATSALQSLEKLLGELRDFYRVAFALILLEFDLFLFFKVTHVHPLPSPRLAGG